MDTSIINTILITGTVEGYDGTITLNLVIKEYDPQLRTDAYSAISINNLSTPLSLSMRNKVTKSVSIEKNEFYERGRLRTTYTSKQLHFLNITTVMHPNENRGMFISYKIGLWLDGRYVKYYVSANDTNYEYEVSLERN